MRTFKRGNVVKKTDNEAKIEKYQDQGFKEITEGAKEEEVEKEVDYESMKVDKLKSLADERGIEYDAKVKKDELIKLLGE